MIMGFTNGMMMGTMMAHMNMNYQMMMQGMDYAYVDGSDVLYLQMEVSVMEAEIAEDSWMADSNQDFRNGFFLKEEEETKELLKNKIYIMRKHGKHTP